MCTLYSLLMFVFVVGDGLLMSHAVVQAKWSGDRAVSQLLLRLLQPKLVWTSGQTRSTSDGQGCWMERRMRGEDDGVVSTWKSDST